MQIKYSKWLFQGRNEVYGIRDQRPEKDRGQGSQPWDLESQYTLFQNGRHLDILLFSFKLDLDASFKAKYSFEFSAQERGIKG